MMSSESVWPKDRANKYENNTFCIDQKLQTRLQFTEVHTNSKTENDVPQINWSWWDIKKSEFTNVTSIAI